MLRKKKINLVLNMCFSIYLLGSIVFNIINMIGDEFSVDAINSLQEAEKAQVIGGILLVIVISTLITIFQNLLIIIIFIAVKLGMKNAMKDKLSNIDLKKYEGYYRDVLKEYSPAVLSYIDDFEVEGNKDVVATILSLKIKGYIDIENTELKILNNKDKGELEENEKYILELIQEGKMENFSIMIFEGKVLRDALNSGLLGGKDRFKAEAKQKAVQFFIMFVILSCIMPFLLPIVFLFDNYIMSIISVVIYMLMVFLCGISPFFYIAYFISYSLKSAMIPYVRTKKGNDVNEMLEGLKNYIKDYSLLDKRNIEEVALWEDYLIYSVIFNQNAKTVENFSELYKINSGNVKR